MDALVSSGQMKNWLIGLCFNSAALESQAVLKFTRFKYGLTLRVDTHIAPVVSEKQDGNIRIPQHGGAFVQT
jgi:hypothetical protein